MNRADAARGFVLASSMWLSLLSSSAAFGALIEVDITVRLDESQIFDAGPFVQEHRWTSDAEVEDISFPEVLVAVGDTVSVNVVFADGERLRWTNEYARLEYAGFLLYGSTNVGQTTYSYNREFSFLDPSGELLFNDFRGPSSSSGGSHGDILGATLNLGKDNLTDSAFEFAGARFQFELLSASQTPPPWNRMRLFMFGGDFEIVPARAVPGPDTTLLLVGGIAGLVGYARRRDAT